MGETLPAPAAPDGSCTNCTYNSGVYLRTGYQVNFGRREAGEFVGIATKQLKEMTNSPG